MTCQPLSTRRRAGEPVFALDGLVFVRWSRAGAEQRLAQRQRTEIEEVVA